MNIRDKVALITGAASGIGQAVASELITRGTRRAVLVDRSDAVSELAATMNRQADREVAVAYVGDTTDNAFRTHVYDRVTADQGLVQICVPAAGITLSSRT